MSQSQSTPHSTASQQATPNGKARGYAMADVETVKEIGQIHFAGNVIPQAWYRQVTLANGKPYLAAIVLLAEIVYWHRPIEERDEATGRDLPWRKRFAADKWQRSTQSLADAFGLSKYQAQEALAFLQKRGLIERELRNIHTPSGLALNNVQYITPNAQAIRGITFKTSATETLPQSSRYPPPVDCPTYTENPTETPIEEEPSSSVPEPPTPKPPASALEAMRIALKTVCDGDGREKRETAAQTLVKRGIAPAEVVKRFGEGSMWYQAFPGNKGHARPHASQVVDRFDAMREFDPYVDENPRPSAGQAVAQ